MYVAVSFADKERNVANQFLGDDVSANAVLNYAVLHLGVCHGTSPQYSH